MDSHSWETSLLLRRSVHLKMAIFHFAVLVVQRVLALAAGMAFALYAETYFPEVDIYGMSIWEIGIIDYTHIFPNVVQYIPDIYKSILDDEIIKEE